MYLGWVDPRSDRGWVDPRLSLGWVDPTKSELAIVPPDPSATRPVPVSALVIEGSQGSRSHNFAVEVPGP